MDSQQHDKVFIVTFLAVLGFLGAFTVGIILISAAIGSTEADDPEALARLEDRIRPAGKVATDPAQLLAAAPAAAARAPMTGAQIVDKVCGACHNAGVLGAPKTGDKGAWGQRKAAGLDVLVASTLNGKGAMPPKGGDPSLSEAEVKAAVEELLKRSGV